MRYIICGFLIGFGIRELYQQIKEKRSFANHILNYIEKKFEKGRGQEE